MADRTPIVPCRWKGTDGVETWQLEIDHDLASEDGEFTVDLWAQCDEGSGKFDSLVAATPAQAREMANALMVYAYLADTANRRLAEQRAQKTQKVAGSE